MRGSGLKFSNNMTLVIRKNKYVRKKRCEHEEAILLEQNMDKSIIIVEIPGKWIPMVRWIMHMARTLRLQNVIREDKMEPLNQVELSVHLLSVFCDL